MALEVRTNARDGERADDAEFGNRDLKVREQLEQEGLEFLVGAVDLVDQQHRRRLTPDGGEQRPLEQIVLREDAAPRSRLRSRPFPRAP